MEYDVAIIGAGPAGSASALLLARGGYRVVLLERSNFDTPRVGESLAPAVQPLLMGLDLWDSFLSLKPLPSYGTRSVWGDPEPQTHSHIATPYGCGWHVNRVAFDRMLARQAQAAGADLVCNARVTRCAQERGGWSIHAIAADSATLCLSAALVIDATGRSAGVGSRLGGRRVRFDRLVGIGAEVVNPKAEADCITQVETTPHGWWYSAPIGANRYAVMLMTDSDLVRPSALNTYAGWHAALLRAPATAGRIRCLGAAEQSEPPRLCSAVSQRLVRSDPTARWLAVGDAALAVDPVSGSGVIRALRTAQAAVSAVSRVLAGNFQAIWQYEVDRNAECTRYLAERAAYYGAEQRWSSAPFWQRRLKTAAALSQ